MTVSLVGVGPGDAELMTLKAARLLGHADAIVHDRLVSAEVLRYASPTAEFYDVGKTPGVPGPTQGDINDLLVSLGGRLDSVVRVKGGDPFVFGRGIEEADACRLAGLAVEVVPGISSAIAGPAMAGISVTERAISSGFCVVTGRQDSDSEPTNWAALAACGMTLVIMMGAKRAGDICAELTSNGLSPVTAAAAVTRASQPDQANWFGTLAELEQRAVEAPSVLVIGAAARQRHWAKASATLNLEARAVEASEQP